MSDPVHKGTVWTTVKQWDLWLARHHNQSDGLWLLIAKKGSEKKSITISEALDVALCYGWIDSLRRGYDADYYLQRYSPRQSKSPWSKINVEKVETLIAARRMRKPGLAVIAAAKADGRWEAAYSAQRHAPFPLELMNALKNNKRAKASFDKLGKTGQYLVVLPLLKATTSAIRQARLSKAIAKLEAAVG
jgi:uncharacterized protein YdeI (YjbR/CyaY-like superfamily)